MFQFWKLVLLCGLLTGTSASPLEGLGNDLNNVVDSLKPILEKGLDTVDNTLEAVLGKLKANLAALQESKLWLLAKQKFQEAEKLVNDALSSIFPSKDKTSGLKVSNSHILDVKAELAPDGQGINLRFPITANVTLVLPLIGETISLKASLDLLSGVRIETNPQTGLPTVVLGECASDPDSISLSLLGRHSTLINKLVDSVTSFLSKTVSFLVQKQLCPLIRIFISTLDVDFIQKIMDKLLQGLNPQVFA